jgi:hypothetical protein
LYLHLCLISKVSVIVWKFSPKSSCVKGLVAPFWEVLETLGGGV